MTVTVTVTIIGPLKCTVFSDGVLRPHSIIGKPPQLKSLVFYAYFSTAAPGHPGLREVSTTGASYVSAVLTVKPMHESPEDIYGCFTSENLLLVPVDFNGLSL